MRREMMCGAREEVTEIKTGGHCQKLTPGIEQLIENVGGFVDCWVHQEQQTAG